MGKMFIGEYLQKLDSKNRFVVPRQLREEIGEEELRRGLYITRGLDKCLFLFPKCQWESVAKDLFGSVDLRGFNPRMLQRLFFSKAVRVEPDKLGRVLLPDKLRALGEIDTEVVVLGVSNRIELWSPARWAAIEAAHEAQFEQLAESLYQVPPAQVAGP